jgi:hypothetical protein
LKKKPKPGQTDRFRFSSVRFFKGKNRFKPVWLGFSGFGSVFSILARFFRFGSVFPILLGFFSGFLSVSVRFGSVRFFRFFVYKTETEPAGFFKKLIGLIGFFFRFGFFGFFFWFSRFNRFSGFFAHP